MAAIAERTTEARPGSVNGRTFHGFGTTVGTWSTEPALVERLDLLMQGWVERVEAACSRFRESSDLSRANAAAGTAVAVAAELIGATTAALAMAEATGGLCDPTVGQAVINAGYDRTFEVIEAEGPGPEGPPRLGGGWKLVAVDAEAGTLTVPAGFRLDLGGSAKGWAVDVALSAVRESLLAAHLEAGVCVGAGGDLGVAGVAPAGGWPVTISDRLDLDRGSERSDVRLGRGAMATSGSTARAWKRGDAVGHHIIDPRTGRPGRSRWRMVTVFADGCLAADSAATAAWLLDADGPDWLESNGLGARLVDESGAVVVAGDLGDWLLGEERSWFSR
jgi:thiamine biosynthesis lipoprotein